jgi:hypothetical protein
MNARTILQGNPPTAPQRFDRKFIEEHKLVERYLEGKLPFRGARDLENWCRLNPEYLNELKLSERAHTTLKLLEASGQPQDLGEPRPPWWKTIHALIGVSALALASLVAFWVLFGKYHALSAKLDDTRNLIARGSLVQPATETNVYLSPDHESGIDRARVIVNSKAPLLMDMHIDLGYTKTLAEFRVVVDKKDQGRALVVNNLLKDSNGELRMTLNSTGLGVGIYTIRIDALPPHGGPVEVGWLILDVR